MPANVETSVRLIASTIVMTFGEPIHFSVAALRPIAAE
jgi:hypothetical protein